MRKSILAMTLLAIATAANAVQVRLVTANFGFGADLASPLITDGSHIQGQPGTTAIFFWDGTSITSTGLYSAVASISNLTTSPTILNDQVVDLSLNTSGTGTAGATSYACVEGSLGASLGSNLCGGYSLGANNVDESSTVWSGLSVNQTIGGDDVSAGPPRTFLVFNGFNVVMLTGTGLNPGDIITIGNGIPLHTAGGASFTFQVVPIPAAAWLFGSALGLMMGWVRRRNAS